MGATIVVGTDGSDASLDAMRWALEEARARDGRLVVVHAWHVPNVPGPMGLPLMTVPREDLERNARAVLDAAIRHLDRGHVEVQPELIEAHPVEALLTMGAGADLLVVGSRGLGGFKRLLLGSVSHQIALHAPCPVVIVPATADG